MKKVFLPALASAILLASCSEVASGLLIDPSEMDSIEVVFSFNPYQMEPIVTKANVSIADLSKRLDVFIVEGANVTAIHQNKDTQAEGFGTVSATLNKTKTYTLYAVAHKGSGELTVTSEKQEKTLRMTRVAAMFRLKLTDAKLPESFARMKFDYTGGSANYNPSNGQGITKSTQSELRAKSTDGIYEVYTFPYLAESGVLQITASALDEQGNILAKHTFKDVPVRRNVITSYDGAFFGDMHGTVAGYTGTFVVDPAWGEINTYTF